MTEKLETQRREAGRANDELRGRLAALEESLKDTQRSRMASESEFDK